MRKTAVSILTVLLVVFILLVTLLDSCNTGSDTVYVQGGKKLVVNGRRHVWRFVDEEAGVVCWEGSGCLPLTFLSKSGERAVLKGSE